VSDPETTTVISQSERRQVLPRQAGSADEEKTQVMSTRPPRDEA
jgi:hypothetical protein